MTLAAQSVVAEADQLQPRPEHKFTFGGLPV
jgi:hypothetical protein